MTNDILDFNILKNEIVSRGTNFENFIDKKFGTKLELYLELLLKWNLKINLIGKSTTEDIYIRHVLDSLQLINHIEDLNKTIIDLGSGAGFPGIILAMLGFQKVNLVESDKRKSIFLKEAAKSLDNVEVWDRRIEEMPNMHSDIITARALAPLVKLLEMAIKFHHPLIEYIFLKGEKISGEIEEAKKIFEFEYELLPSLTNNNSFIIKIRNLHKKERK